MGALVAIESAPSFGRPRRFTGEEWRDKKYVAYHFSVGTSTVDRWCREGMPFEVIGGRRRFKVSECDAWHQSRRAPGVSG